jgi:lysophospholipase L1-like esterase
MMEAPSSEKPVQPRALLVLYVAHLAVPAFFLADLLLHRSDAGDSAHVLLPVFGLWLAAGIALPFFCRDRERFFARMTKPLTGVYAFCFAFFLFESCVAVFPGLLPRNPMMRKPGMKFVSIPDTSVMPGVHGTATFSVNEFGLRGPSLPRQGSFYKLITVGGSTTECNYLDDSKEWPHLLMEDLNRGQSSRPVWVANAGLSGQTSAGHLMLVQTLPALQQADLLVFQTGANDLMASLAFEGTSTQKTLDLEADQFRASILSGSRPRYPWLKRMAVFALVRRAVNAGSAFFRSPAQFKGIDYADLRRERASAPTVPLPDLRLGLEEYGQRILRLQQACKANGTRCLFVTQPSMWRSDLGETERALLWFGWVGRRPRPKGYISVSDAAAAIEAYNRKLLEVCRENSLECFDLAPLLPKDTSAFYDDFHFNEGGAKMVADRMADYLLAAPPFGQENSGH